MPQEQQQQGLQEIGTAPIDNNEAGAGAGAVQGAVQGVIPEGGAETVADVVDTKDVGMGDANPCNDSPLHEV